MKPAADYQPRHVWDKSGEHDDVMLIYINDITCQMIGQRGYIDRTQIDKWRTG